jgi:hypothetical protein
MNSHTPPGDDLDHERIWLQPKCCAGPFDGRQWCEDNVFDDGECEDGAKATEYVRADRISSLEAEKRARDAEVVALREAAFDMCQLVNRADFPATYDRLLALCEPSAALIQRAEQTQHNEGEANEEV